MSARIFETASVSGFLHESRDEVGLALTHGAGANCESPLLIAVAEAFADAGLTVLRFDLEFRRKRRFGPPHPSAAALDRESIREAVNALRAEISGPVYLGGHSYGGRQASMLAAEEREIAGGLMLLSYPLHPPKRADELRTAHFPALRTPAIFVQGDQDPFATPQEIEAAIRLIPAPTRLILIDKAGHDLSRGRFDMVPVVNALLERRAETG